MLWIRDGRDYGIIKFRAVDSFSNPGVLVVTDCLSLSNAQFIFWGEGDCGIPNTPAIYSVVKITIVVGMHIKYD